MKKLALALTLIMVISFALPLQAFAAVSGQEAVNILRALEIMTGDERGDLHLDRQLTRAQLAKMLCASSAFKGSVNETGLGYSVFSDVAPAHWAGQYIKLCVEQGWLSGYSDGSFRPNEPVKLEDACSACLKLLGYSSAQLSGSYPYAQINKAASIGLTESVRGGAGSSLIRQDAAYLFCSLLSCENASGMTYGQTLGYSMSNGKVDMIQAVGTNLKGPYIASASEKLSFTPEKTYLNGKAAGGRILKENDVFYVNEALASLWIYDKKASGKLDQVSPAASPQTLMLAGSSYIIDSSDVSFELSNYGSIKTGDTVTLLLGMDDKVAGIIAGNAVEGSYLGIVLSNVRSAEEGSTSIISTISVFCTDGTVRSFETDRSSASAGSLVSIGVSSSEASVTIHKDKGMEGLFNKAGNRFAGYPVSDDIRIIDSDGQTAVKVDKEALLGKTLKEKDVRYYLLEDGEITDLILNDVTGEIWTFALLTDVSGASSAASVYGNYVFLTNGARGALTSSGIRFMVDIGGIAIKYDVTGAAGSIRQLAKVSLSEISGGNAFDQNVRYQLDPSVQVYLKDRDDYYLMDIEDLEFEGFRVTGWFDDFGLSAGGKIRIITAERTNF